MILLAGLLLGHAGDERGLRGRRDAETPQQSLEQRIQAAGFLPVPGLSAAIAPGALVMRSDGSVFLRREDCFPEATVSDALAALPEEAAALSAGLSLSLGAIGRFLGGRLAASTDQVATIAFDGLAVRGVVAGALAPSEDCLAVLNRQREAGVGLESYLLITEVLQADGLEVKSSRGLSAAAQTDGIPALLSGLGGGLSITSQTDTGIVATGRLTLGYRCRQLVGHTAAGDVENAGAAEACPGFGP
jgi:hypothetical protein